jgi:hypothetical protein
MKRLSCVSDSCVAELLKLSSRCGKKSLATIIEILVLLNFVFSSSLLPNLFYLLSLFSTLLSFFHHFFVLLLADFSLSSFSLSSPSHWVPNSSPPSLTQALHASSSSCRIDLTLLLLFHFHAFL